ncbi:MAG: outer membrane protein assembly factor BamD, partial [Hyphomicrobiales bacterium]|nr:outer membrane protein assembly factor BamD [Hyphomicrobiales bacterium]
VGRFYLEKHQYTAAINRFRQVVAHYQTTRHVEEALERLTEAYFALGVTNEAQTAAAVLGHNFPDSPWYKDAYKLLQTNGLEPREDKGSWLSRAMQGFKSIAAF